MDRKALSEIGIDPPFEVRPECGDWWNIYDANGYCLLDPPTTKKEYADWICDALNMKARGQMMLPGTVTFTPYKVYAANGECTAEPIDLSDINRPDAAWARFGSGPKE